MSNKLDRHNYLLWPSQFEPLLLSHDLIGFVDGSIPCVEQYKPEKDTKPISAVNPKFLTLVRQELNLLSWIHPTLFEHVLSQVVGLRTFQTVWNAIEQRFVPISRVHTIELKRQLQNLQEGNLSITDCLLRHKSIVDELSAIGHFVDEFDHVTNILDGLSKEYDLIIINVASLFIQTAVQLTTSPRTSTISAYGLIVTVLIRCRSAMLQLCVSLVLAPIPFSRLMLNSASLIVYMFLIYLQILSLYIVLPLIITIFFLV